MRKQLILSEKEIKVIKETAQEVFGENTRVFIFGSRTRVDRKGGNVDVLIKTDRKVSV